MSTDPKVKLLEQNINKATSETATQPDSNLFIETCNLINSRGDLPKHGVAFLRKRLMSRNPKVLYLCMEFLEVSTNACELNFFQLVAAKDFMSVLNAITSREMDKTVLDKMTHLVRYWTQVFGGYKDILPGIFAFYESLEKKGVSFPSHVESKYAYLMNEKKKEVSRPSHDPTESHSSSQDSKWQKATTGSGSGSGSGKKASPSKADSKNIPKKLRDDLDLVRQNILLTNEMIDAQDPKEDPKNNDVLTDLMQTLKSMENRLGEFIAKTQDEGALNYLLEINDDLHKTFARYKAIRRGDKPAPFVPSDVQYSIEREDPNKAPKPQAQKPPVTNHADLIDLLGDTSLSQSAPASGTGAKVAEVQNLFDFDAPAPTSVQGFGTAQPTATVQANQPEVKAPSSLSDQLSSLYKTSGPTTSDPMGGFGGQQGGFGGQQLTTSGFPINQGNFQTSPGLGGQGLSQNLGFGGGMGGFGTQQPMGGLGGFGGQQPQGMGGFGAPQTNTSGFPINQGGFQTSPSQGAQQNLGFGGQQQGMGNMGGFGGQQQGMAGLGGMGGMGGMSNMGGMAGMGGFSTASPGGFGMQANTGFGGMGGQTGGMGGQTGGMNAGFGQQQMGGFSTAPSQGNAFNMGGMIGALNNQQGQMQQQQQQKPAVQKSPFDDLL